MLFASISFAQAHKVHFLEVFLLITGACFGMVGVDAAMNLKKYNAKLRKYTLHREIK